MRGADPTFPSKPFTGPVLAVAIALLVAGINLVWLRDHRLEYPLNYDEAAFMAMARYDTLRLLTAGPIGLARAYVVQGPAAPLVPLASVPAQVVDGTGILSSFGVIQLFLVVLALASYGIAARLGGLGAGVLTALVVSTAPGIIHYGRTYHFAVPSTALFAVSLYALMRSDGLQHRNWALMWGMSLGLMPLTRSVTLAVIPGMFLAAVLALSTAQDRGQRLKNLCLALGLGCAIAASWYWRNLPIVLEYLTVGGYGEASALYGDAYPMVSADYWLVRLRHLIEQGLHLPLAASLALFALIGGASRLLLARDSSGVGNRRDWISVSIVLAMSYLALSSSRNVGSGFVLLLLPMVIPLSTAALVLVRSQLVRGLAVLLLVSVSAVNIIGTSGWDTSAAQIHHFHVPWLGDLPVTDGRANIQVIMSVAGYYAGPPSGSIPDIQKRWLEIDRELADLLSELSVSHGTDAVAAFASRDPLLTVGSVRVAGLVWERRNFYLFELSGAEPEDSTAAYVAKLLSLTPRPNVLISADPGPAEAPPRVTQRLAEDAGRQLGFQIIRTIELPGLRTMRVWWLNSQS